MSNCEYGAVLELVPGYETRIELTKLQKNNTSCIIYSITCFPITANVLGHFVLFSFCLVCRLFGIQICCCVILMLFPFSLAFCLCKYLPIFSFFFALQWVLCPYLRLYSVFSDCLMVSCMRWSVAASTAAVASSSIRILDFLNTDIFSVHCF